MKVKILVSVMLLAGAAGAVVRYACPSPPIDILTVTPKSARHLVGGMETVEVGQSPETCRQPGHITVVTYTSDLCSACRKLKRHLKSLLIMRPDVAVRRVNLGALWNRLECRKRYGVDIRSVPHVVIFDAEGNVLARDDGQNKGGLELLYTWMNAELVRNKD